ncbi:MAG: hypothetical protein ACR2OC_05845 [Solirubrobacterales bacterium]
MRAEAERAVALMEEMSTGLRGCAILVEGSGNALAASGEVSVWGEAATRLLSAADAAKGRRAERVHVGTEDGEAFAVRHGELAMVAVTERFTLTSLVHSDMRMILRDLAAGAVVDHRAPARGEVPLAKESEEEIEEAGIGAATPPVN